MLLIDIEQIHPIQIAMEAKLIFKLWRKNPKNDSNNGKRMKKNFLRSRKNSKISLQKKFRNANDKFIR